LLDLTHPRASSSDADFRGAHLMAREKAFKTHGMQNMSTELRRSTKKLICGRDDGERKSRFHVENNVMTDFTAD
jgi:hypothetical protein